MEEEVFDETIPRPRSLFGPTGQEPGRSRHLMWNNVSTFLFFFLFLSSLSSHPEPNLDPHRNPDPHDPHQLDAPLHCRQKIAPRSSHNATQPGCSPRWTWQTMLLIMLDVIVFLRTIIIMFREFSNSYRLIKLQVYEMQLLKVRLTVWGVIKRPQRCPKYPLCFFWSQN